MPFKEYSGDDFVYSETLDEYFFDSDAINSFLEENTETNAEDLMLVICEPQSYGYLDAGYWEDVIPRDGEGEIPKELQDAIDALNTVVAILPAASWFPGKFRTLFVP